MKKIEKFGILAFDVYNNDDLVDKMIDMSDKINEIIDAINQTNTGVSSNQHDDKTDMTG